MSYCQQDNAISLANYSPSYLNVSTSQDYSSGVLLRFANNAEMQTSAKMNSVTQTGVIKFTLREETMSHIFVWKFDGKQLKNLFTFLKLQQETHVETNEIRFSTGSLASFDHYAKFFAVPKEEGKSFWIYCKLYIGDANEDEKEKFTNWLMQVKSVTVSAVGPLEKANPKDLNETFTPDEIGENDVKITWWKKLCVGGVYVQSTNATQMTFVIQTQNQLWKDSKLATVAELCNSPPANKNPGMLETKSLFLCPKFSDVIIQCGDKEFPAHRVVISSKSHVLETMFEHPMKESQEGRLIISDADPEVVEQMLQFMYTGQAKLMEQFASELFVIADKYCIDDLKRLSEAVLVDKIDDENFLELYPVGQLLNSSLMLDKCYEIFKKNRKDILKTEKDLKRFYEKYPELMFRFSTE